MATTTVNATYLTPEGDPCAGSVVFQLVATTYQETADAIYPTTPVRAVLDGTGSIAVELEPTSGDDAAFTATDMTYQVREKINGTSGRDAYYVDIPTSPAIDLGAIATYDDPLTVRHIPADVDLDVVGYATDAELTDAVAEVAATVPFTDLADAAGVDPTGVTECAAELQTAIDAAAAAGQRVYATGTFKINSTITIASNADLGDATFNYTAASGTAVRVGTSTSGAAIEDLQVVCPRVVSTLKVVGSGWGAVAGTIGVDLHNLYTGIVTVPYVQGFETNLRLYGTGIGCVYNQVHVGYLDNGKINILLDANGSGWCNENLILVGRFAHESVEGTAVSGVRHLKLAVCTNPVNNNVFIKPVLEGDVAEYLLEVGGQQNRFIQGRYEAGTPTVRWQSDAASNVIDGGYGASALVQSYVSGAEGSNDVRGHIRHYHTAGGGTSGISVLENQSSASYPATVIMDPGAHLAATSPVTGYRVHQGALYTRMKRAADAADRMVFDHDNGRILFGAGSVAPTAFVQAFAANDALRVDGLHVGFNTDNTYDLGIASFRPRDVRLGRNLIIGGALDHDGSTAGFYGTTPIAKQTGVAVSAAGIHAALVALGLIAA